MTTLRIQPMRTGLAGSVPVPPDAAQASLSLLLAALAEGESSVHASGAGARVLAVSRALGALGVSVEGEARRFVVRGVGLRGFAEPDGELVLDAFGAALFAAVLSGQGLSARIGHPGSPRALARLVRQLAARGVALTPRPSLGADLQRVTLERAPGRRLAPAEVELTPPDASAKAALLLSGLYATGPTSVVEPVISADHIERRLNALGLPIASVGGLLTLHPPSDAGALPALDVEVPGDVSLAAYVLGAAALVLDSRVSARGIGLNPTRTGILDVMRLMGARLSTTPHGERLGEAFGDIDLFSGPLVAAALDGEMRLRSGAELPVFCALAAGAAGLSEIADGDPIDASRVEGLASVLRAFGVVCRSGEGGGLAIEGRGAQPFAAADVDCALDAERGMLATLLALRADGECRLRRVETIAEHYPRFVGTLRALGADIGVEP